MLRCVNPVPATFGHEFSVSVLMPVRPPRCSIPTSEIGVPPKSNHSRFASPLSSPAPYLKSGVPEAKFSHLRREGQTSEFVVGERPALRQADRVNLERFRGQWPYRVPQCGSPGARAETPPPCAMVHSAAMRSGSPPAGTALSSALPSVFGLAFGFSVVPAAGAATPSISPQYSKSDEFVPGVRTQRAAASRSQCFESHDPGFVACHPVSGRWGWRVVV